MTKSLVSETGPRAQTLSQKLQKTEARELSKKPRRTTEKGRTEIQKK